MTLKGQKTKSQEEQEEQTTNSAYDFIYHDGRRIASFLAQFDPSGLLTQLTQGKSANRSSSETSDIESRGGFLGFAHIEGSNSVALGKSVEHEISRVYDPTWANAREFLNVLQSNGLIERNLGSAGLGQFVLLKGTLSVYDLDLVGKMWNLKSVKKMMDAGVPKVPNVSKAQKNNPQIKQFLEAAHHAKTQAMQTLELFSELAPHLPHTVQALVKNGSSDEIWCTLAREGLTMTASDILLKHGMTVPGEWAVLGILDATPDYEDHSLNSDELKSGDMVADIFKGLAPVVRQLFGRPKSAFGVTPLLIFREVKANAAQ